MTGWQKDKDFLTLKCHVLKYFMNQLEVVANRKPLTGIYVN